MPIFKKISLGGEWVVDWIATLLVREVGLKYDKGITMKRKGTKKNWWLTEWQVDEGEGQI